jgi:hypothetical protein
LSAMLFVSFALVGEGSGAGLAIITPAVQAPYRICRIASLYSD